MTALECKKHRLSQNQDGGWRLTLNIHPHEEMPGWLLKAAPGQRMGVALVPIEDEQNQERPALPAEVATAGVHPAPDAVTPGGRSPAGAEQARPRERKLSELAWWFVNKDKAFQTWMMRAAGLKQWPANAMREADTDTWLKEALGIISKSELDTDEAAARAFTALIEKFEVSVGRIRDPAA